VLLPLEEEDEEISFSNDVGVIYGKENSLLDVKGLSLLN